MSINEENVAEATKPELKKFTRDQIRTAILNSEGENQILDVFGVQIELRSPSLEDLLQYRDASTDDTIMGRTIANNCWVPGTNERVFDDADVDSLMQLKFSGDMRKLTRAINNMLGDDAAVQKGVDSDYKSSKE